MPEHSNEHDPEDGDTFNRAFIGLIGGVAVASETSTLGLAEPLPVVSGVILGVALFKGLKIVREWMTSHE